MSKTESDVYGRRAGAHAPTAAADALVIVMNSDDLSLRASRHVLEGVDVIELGRGVRAVIRDRDHGMSRVIVRVPDPLMSEDHGRLLRVGGRWMLEDPLSKNGAIIAGSASRCGMVEPGDLFELGHTTFLLETTPVGYELELDRVLDADPLSSLHPELIAAQSAFAAVARSGLPVLLLGETGTGKEVYARAIHALSNRPGPLISVNCGALPASMIEAELFGHRRGAFSGAFADRPGFVRSADRGTLFLDEIDELSAAGQVALLRVLEEHEVTPVGDSRPIAVDIRVCAACQRPLHLEVDAGRFRSDLYARLLGHEQRLPPLRERPHDIGALIGRLVARLAPGRRVSLAPAAARALVSYEWPRNIRELERALSAALVLAHDRSIELAQLPDAVRAAIPGRVRATPLVASHLTRGAESTADDNLRNELAAKLAEHRGNISAVARDLGKHREQIQRWLRKFGFDADAFRR